MTASVNFWQLILPNFHNSNKLWQILTIPKAPVNYSYKIDSYKIDSYKMLTANINLLNTIFTSHCSSRPNLNICDSIIIHFKTYAGGGHIQLWNSKTTFKQLYDYLLIMWLYLYLDNTLFRIANVILSDPAFAECRVPSAECRVQSAECRVRFTILPFKPSGLTFSYLSLCYFFIFFWHRRGHLTLR